MVHLVLNNSLEEAPLLSHTVDGSVRVALDTQETANCQGSDLSSQLAGTIEMANVDLDASMIAGIDEAIGGRAMQASDDSTGSPTPQKSVTKHPLSPRLQT